MIYQIIAAYFEDDCADELTTDPVFTAALEKEALASQPTLSRFWNRMDADTLTQKQQSVYLDNLKCSRIKAIGKVRPFCGVRPHACK